MQRSQVEFLIEIINNESSSEDGEAARLQSEWRAALRRETVTRPVIFVGAGPAGLAAAHSLSLLGYRVTLFEREGKAGGMLVGAIPAHRLPREVLGREIELLLNPNIQVRYHQALGLDFTLDQLFAEGYRAAFLATGSHQSKKLDVPGEEVGGVIPGIRFLKAFNLKGEELARGRVGIIGGANSAMDAARVAFRQKGVTGVTMFYRRTRTEMPADLEEIEAGLAEGIRIEELVAPVAVLAKNGRLSGVRFIRNRLSEPDASGRRRPVPVPGSEVEVELDTLIAAISEERETEGLDGLRLTKGKLLAINSESLVTSRPGVFAGGDVVGGPGTVIGAVAAGKQAARMIDRYVKGKLMKQLPTVPLPSVYVPPVEMAEEEGGTRSRVHAPELPVAERWKSFAEVELCISPEAAHAEACRCLRCDLEFIQPVR